LLPPPQGGRESALRLSLFGYRSSLLYRHLALADLDAIYAYIEPDNPHRAASFVRITPTAILVTRVFHWGQDYEAILRRNGDVDDRTPE